jgi:beta-D-xylosidase 4
LPPQLREPVLVHLGGGAAYLAVRDAKWLEIGYDGVELTMAAGKVRLDLECGMLWEGARDFFAVFGLDGVRRQGKLWEFEVGNMLRNVYLTSSPRGSVSWNASGSCSSSVPEPSARRSTRSCRRGEAGNGAHKNDHCPLPLVDLFQSSNGSDVMLGDYTEVSDSLTNQPSAHICTQLNFCSTILTA